MLQRGVVSAACLGAQERARLYDEIVPALTRQCLSSLIFITGLFHMLFQSLTENKAKNGNGSGYESHRRLHCCNRSRWRDK
jgi:hypothetical protein